VYKKSHEIQNTTTLTKAVQILPRYVYSAMVDLKILPGNGGRYGIWRGRKGRQFALHIGKRRRNYLMRFIVKRVEKLPVQVSLLLLDRTRESAAYPVLLGVRQYVAFIVGQFFILINKELLTEAVKSSIIGVRTFNQEELVDVVCS
jgi:hypothetical protein